MRVGSIDILCGTADVAARSADLAREQRSEEIEQRLANRLMCFADDRSVDELT